MTKSFDALKAELLRDPAVRAEYDARAEEFEIASELITARLRAGLSQEQLARRMDVSQSAVARIESGRHWPSRATLQRYAEATGTRPVVRLIPLHGG
ncbi:MAG TPA: helix-turn-helix transcriptional regulator [Stellaceae bacterium]|nr:helix-turn-helix transcriptional regulator [Stellaceae bacterium]